MLLRFGPGLHYYSPRLAERRRRDRLRDDPEGEKFKTPRRRRRKSVADSVARAGETPGLESSRRSLGVHKVLTIAELSFEPRSVAGRLWPNITTRGSIRPKMMKPCKDADARGRRPSSIRRDFPPGGGGAPPWLPRHHRNSRAAGKLLDDRSTRGNEKPSLTSSEDHRKLGGASRSLRAGSVA